MALLFDFEQGLIETHNLLVVLLTEVVDHRNGGASLTLLKTAGLGTHVPSDGADLVCLVVTIAGHNDCVFELIIDGFLDFVLLWRLAGVALALLREADHLLIYQLEAVVH